jgi:arginyl-tRNA synthetase
VIRQAIEQAIKDALGTLGAGETTFVVERPGDMQHGDYATNAALAAAKTLKKNPREVADILAKELQGNIDGVEKIDVAGAGFINFFLSGAALGSVVAQVIDTKDLWGSHSSTQNEWLVEHTSPNPNKAMHIGHLRNNITGMAIGNIAEFNGIKVIRDCVDNNRGIAIAKLMWGYLKFAKKDGKTDSDLEYWFNQQNEWQTPADLSVRPDRFVDSLYVRGSEDFENSKEVEERVRKLVVEWEQGNEKVRALWKKVLDYSYEGQHMTLTRLGNKWDQVWHEHEHYEEGKRLVEEGLDKGIFKKLEDGAVLTDLSSYNLPDTVVQKSDGTSLYITQDLALTRLKRETYHPDRLFWVIGPEQSLALKQMFAVCEQLGIGKYTDYTHISYGYMSLKGEGKMSSRKGNVLFIDDLIDRVKAKVEELLRKSTFSSEEIEDLSEKVALGAVKFGILKTGRTTDISFDIERSTDLQGDTGPYLQYTYARTNSLVERARAENIAPTVKGIRTNNVVRSLIHFPEIVAYANKELEPHLLATYLLELAGVFNSWYAQEQILDGTPEVASKVAVVEAVRITLKNGLTLLGIPAPEKM